MNIQGKTNTGVKTIQYFESDLLPQSQSLNIGLSNLKWNNIYTQRIAIPSSTSNPTNPVTGQVYFNASTNTLKIYNGSAWKSVVLV